MSNIVNYSDIMAFHPGYYVAEIIEDMGITQDEFATRLGTTGKTLSKLINGQIKLSHDLAKKLSAMLGSSVEFWLNLQVSFEKQAIEIERKKELDEQKGVVSMIDYSFFEKVAKLPATHSAPEKIANLCKYLVISDLRILAQPDFLANFRTGINTIEEKNVINAQAWLQTAINFAKKINTEPFSAEKLKSYLPTIRNMTVQNPDVFLSKLRNMFAECGVAFVLLPHLKNSGINGAVKWITHDCVMLAMNDRRTYADTFWFSLFHEIKHVLQQKTKNIFVSANSEHMQMMDAKLEKEADEFAQNYLIPAKDYSRFAPNKYTSDAQIVAFAKTIGIHPGVVVGRLQHDGIIASNRCAGLRQKYKIILE